MLAPRRILLIILVLLLLLLFLVVPGVSFADAFQDAARELAKKIVALTGPRQTVALTVRSISSLADAEVSAVRRALEAELRAAGLRLADKPNGASELRVTLSENVQGLLWVAELLRDDGREVAMISLPKGLAAAPKAAPQLFALQSKFIWDQDDPILDFALTDLPSGATPSLLVLEPGRLVLYRLQGGGWQLQQSAAIPGAGPWSRDLRGRLLLNRTSFTIHVPGIECTGGAPLALELKCSSEDFWTLQWTGEVSAGGELVRARNSFANPQAARGITNREKIPSFFAIAGLRPKTEELWLLTTLDGRTSLYTDMDTTKPELLASLTGWGSDIAAIETDCGSRWQVLASRPGDWTEPDAITAFDIVARQPFAVSRPMEFPGPVTALWGGADRNSAIAVVRNLETRRYEAYTLTLSCGR